MLKLSGSLLGTAEDRLLLSTYLPPSDSRFYDVAVSNCHTDEVEQYTCNRLDQFGEVNRICNGDFNTRTATYKLYQSFVQNFADERDVKDRTDICENSRVSQDTNDFGRTFLNCVYYLICGNLTNAHVGTILVSLPTHLNTDAESIIILMSNVLNKLCPELSC